MSEEVKDNKAQETQADQKAQNTESVPESSATKPVELKVVENKETSNSDQEDCLFVSEDATFDVTVKYTSVNGKIFVEGVDEKFPDIGVKSFTVTFKYPNHGDCGIINTMARAKGINGSVVEGTMRDYQELEAIRMSVLIRSWSLKKDLTDTNVLSLDPKIIHGMLNGVRDRIGVTGLL